MASPKQLDDPLRATADHIIPYSLGGNLIGNIKAAHFKCNVERGNKLI
ncbi:MAG: HNH endonuclease [Cytophagales bacterium]|nr:HNH endonuclease [Cytophagales bacterium]